MKFKIAICDDEQNQIDYMASIVASWSAHAGHNCEIRTFASAEAFLFEYEEDKAFDILLLDIEMENMNGIELAKRIRKDHNRAEIIFITSHFEFVWEGYEVDALDFIVKPADQFSINYVLDKAINRLESTSSTLIAIKTSDGIVSLSSNDITYVEVFDHNLVYHTTKGVYDVRGRLSDVLKKLDPKRFIMCNRSFVVNLRYVQSACNDYLTIDGTKISVSKSHRKEIMQHFSNFLGENV